MKRHSNRAARRILGAVALLFCALSSQCNLPTASAIEATFTPNPQDSVKNGGDGGPLPVSMQQRQQLLQLEAAIVNSQDPSATLGHVAQQNGMSQEELVGMLDRNRKDLQESGQLESMAAEADATIKAAMQAQGGGGGGGSISNSLPRRILSLVASIFMALLKTASLQISRNPKQSTVLAILLACTLLAVHNAPRNGVVISSGGAFPPFSRGHTTILEPPIDYLERYCVSSWEKGGWTSSLPEPIEVKATKKSSKSNKKSTESIGGVGMTRTLQIDTSYAKEGEVTVETSKPNVDGFDLVTTAKTLVTLDSDDETISDNKEEALEYMHESVTSILDERKFTEFVSSDTHPLKFRSFLLAEEDSDVDDDAMEGAVLAMKLLGDFGRYGVQPMCISYEMDDAEDNDYTPLIHCVAFHTLTGGHFDGEIRFLVEELKSKKKKSKKSDEPGVVISVTLAIPKGGRAPPVRLAESMVSSLAQSIAQSSQMRIKQTISRRMQSRSYRARASGRASEKRHLRFEQERLQEEMAAERKRKWKRNNPDAGHYRPSGHRLKHPHNCGLS